MTLPPPRPRPPSPAHFSSLPPTFFGRRGCVRDPSLPPAATANEMSQLGPELIFFECRARSQGAPPRDGISFSRLPLAADSRSSTFAEGLVFDVDPVFSCDFSHSVVIRIFFPVEYYPSAKCSDYQPRSNLSTIMKTCNPVS